MSMVLSIVLQESAQPSVPAVPMTSMLTAASADPHCPLLGADTSGESTVSMCSSSIIADIVGVTRLLLWEGIWRPTTNPVCSPFRPTLWAGGKNEDTACRNTATGDDETTAVTAVDYIVFRGSSSIRVSFSLGGHINFMGSLLICTIIKHGSLCLKVTGVS